MYNRYNKNKTDDHGRQREFKQGVDFYISMGAIFVECNDGSNNTIQKTDDTITYEQQLVVCVLEIPTIETQTGSKIFDRIDPVLENAVRVKRG
jgi:hypothetical protein